MTTNSISISRPLSVCNVGCVDSFVLRAMAVRLPDKMRTLRGVRKVTELSAMFVIEITVLF